MSKFEITNYHDKFFSSPCSLYLRGLNKVSDIVPNSTSPNPGHALDYELLLDCVHCGLCTSACPTYVETGDENESPRGRIYLMRGVTDGKLELNDARAGAFGIVPGLPGVRNGVPVGRAVWEIDRAVSRGDGSSARRIAAR